MHPFFSMFHKLPSDMKDLVHQHRAAIVIQRFFRNSLYYVECVLLCVRERVRSVTAV